MQTTMYIPILIIHILAGVISILSGFIALFTKKGLRYHRKAGTVFTISMILTGAGAAYLGYFGPVQDVSDVVSGLMTIYLVVTAQMALRRKPGLTGYFEYLSFFVASIGAALCFMVTLKSVEKGTALRGGMPGFIFASFIAFAALGDLRILVMGGLYGAQRIARHIWRMCMGMFIAVGSFFLGQMQVFPKQIQKIEIVSIPVITVIVLMLYWLARVLFTGWYRKSLARKRHDQDVQ